MFVIVRNGSFEVISRIYRILQMSGVKPTFFNVGISAKLLFSLVLMVGLGCFVLRIRSSLGCLPTCACGKKYEALLQSTNE